MKLIRSLFVSICVSGVLLFITPAAFGQGAMDGNYEVAVNIFVGSNEAGGKGSLPANLNVVAQQLKSRVGYANFRLAGTIIGRMANKGNFEYKSFSDLFGNDPRFRTFLNVDIGGLQGGGADKLIQLQSMRFGARVPVIIGYRKDDAGKEQPAVNYEQIGLTTVKLGMQENVPTLIGTLDVPNGTDMIFLVMTVKQLDR